MFKLSLVKCGSKLHLETCDNQYQHMSNSALYSVMLPALHGNETMHSKAGDAFDDQKYEYSIGDVYRDAMNPCHGTRTKESHLAIRQIK